MEARPPALIDAVVRALIPPVCREAVLGDLWERYTTPSAYLGEALRALPFLIASRIRRTTNAAMLSLAFLMLFASFGGAPSLFLRAAIPALVILTTFVLRDVYRGLSSSATRRAAGDAVAVALAAAASQVVLAVVRPELLLNRWGVLTGTLTCLALIAGRSAGRHWTGPREAVAAGAALSLDELRGEMQQTEQAARRTRLVESGAGLLVVAGGLGGTWLAPQAVARIGFALMAAGAAFVIVYLHRHALKPMPMDLGFEASRVVLRDALLRGERLLRTIWLWYLLPLMVGPVVLIIGWSVGERRSVTSVAGFLLVMALVTALVIRMNLRVARSLASRVAALDRTHERE
jgi:hypothetical protein